MTLRTIVLFFFVALLAGMPVQAQESTTSPHGVLPKVLACTSCHRNDTWSPLLADPAFDHSADTAFPLDGQHVPLSCISCHESLRFDAPRASVDDCETCHETPHTFALSQTCADCHSSASFQEVAFEEMHWSSEFELIGVHESVACETCHSFPSLALQPGIVSVDAEACISCHSDDYERQHGQGFPETCLDCHNQSTWADASFDHAGLSGFELVGAHEVAVCASCHVEPGYELTFNPSPAGNEDCLTCHQSDYDAEHGSGFPETCLDCHNQSSWEDASFDHTSVANGFELVGAHEVAVCASCHVEPGYELTFNPPPSGNEDCLTCHQSDYDAEHGGGFPETCLDCHNQSTWDDASFDHAGLSGFELVGAHEVAVCASCHVEPGYELTFSPPPSGNDDCITCHQSDYNSEHGGSNFPPTCLTCHNQVTWDDATFSHPDVSNGFELIGAHEIAACESCHTVPSYDLVFTPPPSGNDDCITCHQSDYNSEHGGSGFPITCLDCHSQTTWDDASFDHDAAFFPIYSGEHRGEWSQCSDCHRSAPVTFATFSCIDCHEHSQSRMNDEHDDVSGYVWDSIACLSCHPDGRE